jgi:hypothetical protein
VYEALGVLRLRSIFNRLTILDFIFYQIVRRFQQGRGTVVRQEEGRRVIRIPNGDVAVGVEDVVFMQDVRGRDQAPEQVVEIEQVAVPKVACGHDALILRITFLLNVMWSVYR